MKKILLTALLVLTSMVAPAQTFNITALHLSIKESYQKWSDVTWQECDVPIMLDLDNSMLTILCNRTQYIKLIRNEGDNNSNTFVFYSKDKDDTYLNVKFTILKNGGMQVYLVYSNIQVVYEGIVNK